MNKSLTSLLTASLCIWAFCGLCAPSALAQPAGGPDLKAICDEIAKACPGAALKSTPTPEATEKLNDAEAKLKGLTYDDATLKAVDAELKGNRTDPVKLYIANLLTKPILDARPEVMKKALPMVEAAWKSLCAEYKEFPKYTAAQLAPLQPAAAVGSGGGPALLAKMAQINKAQEVKADADRLVEVHNKEAWKLEATYFRMCIVAGDAARDKTVMQYMLDREKQKFGKDIPAAGGNPAVKAPCNGLWTIPVYAIKTEVKSLSKERAKFYYDELKKIGLAWKWDVRNYFMWNDPTTSRTENSKYDQKPVHMGTHILEIVNLLAPVAADAANAPAVDVPTEQAVDKHNEDLKPKPKK